MTAITYNPILETAELTRFRLADPIRPPRIGTALVLERLSGERVVVKSGERVPDRRMGNYHRSYLVDLGRYGVKLQELLPSKDPSFSFDATIGFACQVVDPVEIVAGGIHDMTAAVRGTLVRTMRSVASSYDVLHVADAESALNSALDRLRSGPAIRLDGFVVELDTEHASEIHDVLRTARLDAMRRDEMSGVVRGGRDELIAQLLAKNNGDPSGLLEHEAAMKTLENEHFLDALRIVSASGEKVEGFDTRKQREQILGRFLGTNPEGKEQPRRLSRRSRVVGSIGSEPAKPADAAEEPAEGKRPPRPEASGARESRVRGTRPRRAGDRDAGPDGG